MLSPLTPGQLENVKNDVLAARDLLNRMLDLAASNGIQLSVRLVSISKVGAVRAGVPEHNLVEVTL